MTQTKLMKLLKATKAIQVCNVLIYMFSQCYHVLFPPFSFQPPQRKSLCISTLTIQCYFPGKMFRLCWIFSIWTFPTTWCIFTENIPYQDILFSFACISGTFSFVGFTQNWFQILWVKEHITIIQALLWGFVRWTYKLFKIPEGDRI